MFIRHPIRLLAIAVGVLAVSLVGFSAGQAQDISLKLSLQVWASSADPDDPNATQERSRAIQTTVTATYGETASLTIGEGEASRLVMDITPEAVDSETYRLRLNLREIVGDEETSVADPVILARFGDHAQVSVDGADHSGYAFQVLGEKRG